MGFGWFWGLTYQLQGNATDSHMLWRVCVQIGDRRRTYLSRRYSDKRVDRGGKARIEQAHGTIW